MLTSTAPYSETNTGGGCMKIDTEFIKLDSFLKAVDAVCSGGEAKIIISEGMVSVNGEVEFRRGRKLRPGDRVDVEGNTFLVE
jgi:ribosome-associated protein